MPIYSVPSDCAIHCPISPARQFINLITTIKSILSRLLPLPLSSPRCCQFTHFYAHLPPSLRAPAPHETQLDSIHHFFDDLPFICHSLWFFPQAALIMFLMSRCYSCFVLFHIFCIIKFTPIIASWLPASALQKCPVSTKHLRLLN